jgi:hypothetical protein
MNSNDEIYKIKYLKYKQKYLNLKIKKVNLKGGAVNNSNLVIPSTEEEYNKLELGKKILFKFSIDNKNNKIYSKKSEQELNDFKNKLDDLKLDISYMEYIDLDTDIQILYNQSMNFDIVETSHGTILRKYRFVLINLYGPFANNNHINTFIESTFSEEFDDHNISIEDLNNEIIELNDAIKIRTELDLDNTNMNEALKRLKYILKFKSESNLSSSRNSF